MVSVYERLSSLFLRPVLAVFQLLVYTNLRPAALLVSGRLTVRFFRCSGRCSGTPCRLTY